MQRKLFVIGPSQSGKTCLAVGLANTYYGKTLFRRAFRAKAGGQESQLRLSNLTKMIEGEKWPEGNIGKYPLDFVFEKKGKTERFFFNDYKGEDSTSPAFLKELGELDNNDGVILLVNPGFNFPCVRDAKGNVRRATDAEATADKKPEGYFVLSAFDDSPLAREWLVDQKSIYDQLIRNLNTKNNGELKAVTAKPVVAVVVTASDRIGREGDLLAIRPQFEKFLAQIATGLEAAGFEWRSFRVSITGVLADQSKPRLDLGLANTPARPFLWVLHKLWWRSVRGKWICAVKWAAGIVLAAGFSLGAYAWTIADNWEKQSELINAEINAIKESGGKRGSTNDIGKVDGLFSAFTPILPNIRKEYNALLDIWEGDKPEVRIKHVRYVLRESSKEHGLPVLGKLYPLADIIDGQESATEGKAKIAEELDRRLGDEWREFAIPDFARSALTNATQKAVSEFQAQLKNWSPVTTNGDTAKAELIALVATNALLWRMDYAVNSRSLEALAELYPTRFPTNEFLTSELVSEQWETRGKPAFDKAVKAYLDGIVSEIIRRNGDLTIIDADKEIINSKAKAIGNPFNREEALEYVTKAVAAEEKERIDSLRKIALDWINDKERFNLKRNRTGDDSFWAEYECFVKANQSNPFIESIIRPAVYAQAERWLENDIKAFGRLKCGDVNFVKSVDDVFEPFKKLCRKIANEEQPFCQSWAWHFAKKCVNDNLIDGAMSCFPQSFKITKVEGRIDYGDFRNTYEGTELTVDFDATPFDDKLVPFKLVKGKELQKSDNRKLIELPFNPCSYNIHPFDRFRIRLKANDKIVCGRHLNCEVSNNSYSGFLFSSLDWKHGVQIGGEFDLRKETVFVGKGEWWQGRLTTKDPTPEAYVKIYGQLKGNSIQDMVEKAKSDAEMTKKGATK